MLYFRLIRLPWATAIPGASDPTNMDSYSSQDHTVAVREVRLIVRLLGGKRSKLHTQSQSLTIKTTINIIQVNLNLKFG